MDTRDQVLALIGLIYAAPGDLTAWHTFLRELCSVLDGSTAQFVSHDVSTQAADVALAVHLEPAAIKEYAEYWGSQDPWVHSKKARDLVFPGAVVAGEQLVPKSELHRTAYYHEYGRKYDVTQALASVIESGPDRLSFLAVSGGISRPSFAQRETDLLSLLVPHLERALQLHRRLSNAEFVAQGAIDALDRTNEALLILDDHGRVIRVNPWAQALLRARDGLVVDRGELRTATATGTTQLRALVARAIETSRGTGMSPGGVLFVARPSGLRPLRVVVSPVTHRPNLPGPDPAGAIVLVTDPDRRPVPSDETIRALLSLTPAEARLARALAEGLTLERAAHRLGLTVGTARTRLKTIFHKADVHRQIDLVRLVLNL